MLLHSSTVMGVRSNASYGTHLVFLLLEVIDQLTKAGHSYANCVFDLRSLLFSLSFSVVRTHTAFSLFSSLFVVCGRSQPCVRYFLAVFFEGMRIMASYVPVLSVSPGKNTECMDFFTIKELKARQFSR